ncbi:MAG: hypothetical protein GEV28_23900 [Actinophytocola sp.]|uniref:VWD domain-containing protein n=1 Tax=Actinophytocola sp. TaxID=1872138 RepID=UPI00132AAA3A|nr:VWD domain-containing protein [Actinophytocola sp.]MPZ83269.1 hypothetical protein [Actinophytocola sp.]
MSRRKALIALVTVVIMAVVGAVLVVVTDHGVAGTPAAGKQPSPWQRIESIPSEEDGSLGLEPSLEAFAYLFGGLPGVRTPSGPPEPKGFSVSGSGPVRWVLHHWAELTPEQRVAVGAVLAPTGAPRLRGQSDKDKAAQVLRPEVDKLVADIGARLGRDIPAPVMYLVDVEHKLDNGSPVFAWSLALADGESIDQNAEGPVINENGGPATSCNLYLPPSLWRSAAGTIPADARTTLAHEIVHCYQGFTYPTLTADRAAPRWVIEGGAEFGGVDVGQHAAGSPTNWFYYLAQQAPLFDRSYSAMGWWFHLQHVGHDPWRSFPGIWAGATGNIEAYVTAGGDLDDVYDTWASSLLRNPGYGDAWEVHGVDVAGDVPAREKINAEGGSLSVAAFDARVAEVTGASPAGGADTIVLVTANQPIRVHDSGGFEDVHVTEGDYCLGGACVCPEDTERAGEEIQKAEGPLWLALPGGETGTAVTTDTITIEEYCRKKPPERRRPEAPPAAPAGTHPHAPATNPHSRSPRQPDETDAGSNGDPHLTSFDGHRFDFQAGGEFTLARSDAGDLEIQARQEPFRGADGAENLSVSVNTAVAATVAGDRVTVTAAPTRPELRVDGALAAPREEQALPHGGAVAPASGGYLVRWPDGSTLWVVPIGGYGLHLVVRPAADRKGTLHGMLGPFEGVPGNPAMTDRGAAATRRSRPTSSTGSSGRAGGCRPAARCSTTRPGSRAPRSPARTCPARRRRSATTRRPRPTRPAPACPTRRCARSAPTTWR